MNKITTMLIAAGLTGSLSACVATSESVKTTPDQKSAPVAAAPVSPDVEKTGDDNQTITLNQIMSDPAWLGRQPENMGWSVDGSELVYERERENSELNDVYAASVTSPAQASKVPLSELHRYRYNERVESNDGQYTAYRFEDSVFVLMPNGENVQLTRGGAALENLRFMTDNRLMAQSGNRIVAINLQTGRREQLLSWAFAEEPEAVSVPEDFVASEQITLIEYIAK